MKLIFTGDWHLRGTNPRNRIGSYVDAAKAKLLEVFEIAKEVKAVAILVPGDIFDAPQVADSVKSMYADLLQESQVPIVTTPGNHDLSGYNLETYENGSLKILSRMVPGLRTMLDPGEPLVIIPEDGEPPICITFTPYSGKVDRDGYGYSPEDLRSLEGYLEPFRIHVAHAMALDHVPPFDRYTLLQDVKTEADLVLTGHDHTGYGVFRRADGKVFCNPGALMRSSASMSELERPIQIAVIDVRAKDDFDITLVPLKSAKVGSEVLDRSGIEADKERSYAMESFAALIKTNTGAKVLLDIPTIIETIAAQEGIDAEVIATALKKIEEARAA
ncbi:MAG: metallophosphoesterase [Desulfosporosinus sp.]|nr:metallophosphoesterase [Desulfosporosinus sp.]